MPPLTLTSKLLREPRLATLPARAWRMFLSLYVLADDDGNLPVDAELIAMVGDPSGTEADSWMMTKLADAGLVEMRAGFCCVKIRRKPQQQQIQAEPAMMAFPCRDGTWHLMTRFAQELNKLFPDVNVPMQVALAKEWVLKSKGNRKKTTGMRAFLMNWMKRTDDTKKVTGARTAPLPVLP